jgi:hypothetical protein
MNNGMNIEILNWIAKKTIQQKNKKLKPLENKLKQN